MGRGFLAAFRRMNDACSALRAVRVLPPNITTITFTGTLSATTLPVESMRAAALVAHEFGDAIEEFEVDDDVSAKMSKKLGGQPSASAAQRFRYQLPLKRRGKSVKIFHNGSLHVTGCRSPLEFLEVAEAALEFIRHTTQTTDQTPTGQAPGQATPDQTATTAGQATPDSQRPGLLDFDTHLINALCVAVCPATGRPLNVSPSALMAALQTGDRPMALVASSSLAAAPAPAPNRKRRKLTRSTHAEFDAERHPSVKIPLVTPEGHKVATVCVFQTGSISVMGARTPEYLADAFVGTCALLDAVGGTPDATRTMRTTTARRPLFLDDGYPFDLKACCAW